MDFRHVTLGKSIMQTRATAQKTTATKPVYRSFSDLTVFTFLDFEFMVTYAEIKLINQS